SPEFIERNGAPSTPEELQPEQCIAMFRLGTNQIREWMYAKNGVEHTIFPRAALSFSDPQSAVTAAVSGAGFVHSLDFTVEAQIASGLLQPVLQDWNGASYTAGFVVHPGGVVC